MTNKDRLISLCGFAPADDNSIEGEMIDFGVTGADFYDGSLLVPIKKAAIHLMELLLTTADTQNENTYQIKYDRDAVLERINLLKGELGLIDDSQPYITSRSVW